MSIGASRAIAVDRHGAVVVRCIFAWREEGQTLWALAANLNRHHHPSPLGGKWSFTTVKDILDNREIYEGSVRGNTKVPWPAILKRDGARAT